MMEPTHKILEADTNLSESFTRVLKRLKDWKEVHIDMIALSFERLCQFYDCEIMRGQYNLGTYRVRTELMHLYDREKGKPIKSQIATVLEDIVENIRSRLSKIKKRGNNSRILQASYV